MQMKSAAAFLQQVFLLLFLLKVVSSQVIYLNSTHNEYDGIITSGYKSICKKPLKKTLDRIWKTTYFEVTAPRECSIYEAAKIDDLENSKNLKGNAYLYYSQKLLNKVNNLITIRKDDEPVCHHEVYVQTFKHHCIGVETTGKFRVTINYNDFDKRLILCFILGFAFYYLAKPISRNEYFHYGSGVSLGVVGALLVLLIIALKYIPRKRTAFVAFVSGGSVMAFTLRWIILNFKSLAESLQIYLLYYVIASALLSWAFLYYRGPVRSERGLNLIEITLKALGILLIYFGTSLKEISILCIILIFSVKFLLKILNSKVVSDISYKFFPPKRQLLSTEEYSREAHEYTAKALRELRDYCKSPDCNSWKVLSRIKQPDRLARFVESGEPHVTEEELYSYENYTINNDLLDDDDNSEYYDESNCNDTNNSLLR